MSVLFHNSIKTMCKQTKFHWNITPEVRVYGTVCTFDMDSFDFTADRHAKFGYILDGIVSNFHRRPLYSFPFKMSKTMSTIY